MLNIATKTTLVFLFMLLPTGLLYFYAGYIPTQSFIPLWCGVSAFSLMSLNLVLATRLSWLEKGLGGLDRLYVWHKFIGLAVVVLVFIHQEFDIDFVGKPATPNQALAKEVAEFVYPILLVLLLVSAFKRLLPKVKEIPYAIWRFSHRFMGIVFCALVFHQYFIKAPFTDVSLIANYLLVLGFVGVLCFLYSQLIAPRMGKKYRIDSVETSANITNFIASPVSRSLRCKPGQFAIIAINQKGLKEPHPFTIAGMWPDGRIKFSIRGLGDYTNKLPELLKSETTLRIKGGYGAFDYQRGGKKQLWVAGGIGITPFLSFAESLTEDNERDILLVYSEKSQARAIQIKRLRVIAKRIPGFTFKMHYSSDSGRLDGNMLLDLTDQSVNQRSLWFCGPVEMRKNLLKQLKKSGQAPRSVHYEQFEFR